MGTLTGAVTVASVFPGRVAGVSCAAHEGRPSAEAFLAVTVYHGAHLIPEDLEHGVSETRWVFKTSICQDKKAPSESRSFQTWAYDRITRSFARFKGFVCTPLFPGEKLRLLKFL